jgi:hypothetical protein
MSRQVPVIAAAVLLSSILGCATTAGTPSGAPRPAAPSSESSPLGSPFADRRPGGADLPLIIDRTDLRIGTTVQFRRIPTASELHDLEILPGIARVVISFDRWPLEYAPLDVLNQVPQGIEPVIVLPGWPPSRAAAEAWNYLRVPMRIIVIVTGPPPGISEVTNLNQMRGFERMIAQMDEPSRSGFERLQRPLSFRKIVE